MQTDPEQLDNRADVEPTMEGIGDTCQWDDCDHIFSPQPVTSRMVATHFKQKHPEALVNGLKLKCKWSPICPNSDEMVSKNVVKHVANCHLGVDKSSCDRCGAVVSTKNSLKRHQLKSKTCRRIYQVWTLLCTLEMIILSSLHSEAAISI